MVDRLSTPKRFFFNAFVTNLFIGKARDKVLKAQQKQE